MPESPHDVLAAEEFGMPAPDPDLRGPAKLPEDPNGDANPHDVLATEEFPMPAVHRASAPRAAGRRRPRLIGAGLLALLVLRRRRN